MRQNSYGGAFFRVFESKNNRRINLTSIELSWTTKQTSVVGHSISIVANHGLQFGFCPNSSVERDAKIKARENKWPCDFAEPGIFCLRISFRVTIDGLRESRGATRGLVCFSLCIKKGLILRLCLFALLIIVYLHLATIVAQLNVEIISVNGVYQRPLKLYKGNNRFV